MQKYVTLYLQQNLARRHEPTAALNRLMDELLPFTYLTRDLVYLRSRVNESAFPEVLELLKGYAFSDGKLPRIIPVACIQEPNVSNNNKITGFQSKRILACGDNPRAAIVVPECVRIALVDHVSNRDRVWGLLTYKGSRVGVCSFYSDITVMDINLQLDQVKQLSHKYLILGDSNSHSTLWGSNVNNTRGDMWEHFLMRNNLSLLNEGNLPTFENHIGSTHIDISVTNDTSLFNSWHNTELFNGSDHSLILIKSFNGDLTNQKRVQNVAKTDWTCFRENLPPLDLLPIESPCELNKRAATLVGNIRTAFDIACPPKRPYPGRPCKWWTASLSNLLRKKNLAARQARTFIGTRRGLRAHKIKKALAKLFQNTLRKEKSESWKKFTATLTGYKNISTLFKNLKHSKSSDVPLLQMGDIIAKNAPENLEILRKAHFNNSTTSFELNYGLDNTSQERMSEQVSLFMSLDLLKKAIDSLPNGKAPGPDGIKNEVIKRLPDPYIEELLLQIRASISFSYIPINWLNMQTIFIRKGGDRPLKEPKSYRPIGLSNSILKLCERMVNWRLKDTVLKSGVPKQHAFTLGYSTETAISEIVHFLEKAKLNGQKAMLLSLDIQGAFDTVPFDVIKRSLADHG